MVTGGLRRPGFCGAGLFAENLSKKDEEAVPKLLPPWWMDGNTEQTVHFWLQGATASRWQILCEAEKPGHINPCAGLQGSPFALKPCRVLLRKTNAFVCKVDQDVASQNVLLFGGTACV